MVVVVVMVLAAVVVVVVVVTVVVVMVVARAVSSSHRGSRIADISQGHFLTAGSVIMLCVLSELMTAT